MEHRRSEKHSEGNSREFLDTLWCFLTGTFFGRRVEAEPILCYVRPHPKTLGENRRKPVVPHQKMAESFRNYIQRRGILAVRTKPTTLTCSYLQPEYAEDLIVYKIGNSLREFDIQEVLTLVRYPNCRIEKTSGKTASVVSLLEALTLVSRQGVDT
jgi:hypothetical protein